MVSSKAARPEVSIPSIGASYKEEDDIQDEARLLYVAMTRATHELVMSYVGSSLIVEKLENAMNASQTV